MFFNDNLDGDLKRCSIEFEAGWGVIMFLEVQTHGKICDLSFQFLILNIVTY